MAAHCTGCGQTLVEFVFCSACSGEGVRFHDHEFVERPCEDCTGSASFALEADSTDRCPDCRKGQYGGRTRSEAVRLFEPAPEQYPGQTTMEGME